MKRLSNGLNNGAKPTDTVDRLFKENGIYEKRNEKAE